MTTQPVASVQNEYAQQRAAVAPSPPATIDFLQMLGSTVMPSRTTSNQTPSSSATVATGRANARSSSPDPGAAAAAAAAAAAVPVPLPLQVPAQTPQALAAATAAASAATAQTAAASILPPGATAAADPAPATATGAGGDGTGTGAAGQGTPAPPTAAALNARVVAGAPNYLSQPSNMLAALFHHGGDAATANGASPADEAGGDAAAAPAGDAQAAPQAALDGKAAIATDALAAQSHAAPGVDPGVGDTTAADASATAAAAPGAGDAASAATGASAPVPGAPQSTQATAAAAPQAPSAPAHVLPAYEQVAVNLKQAAQSGAGRIEIQLKPASLGAIDVKLDVTHDGRITAMISADRADTLNLLRQDSSGLEQALRDAGLQADSGSLSFNLRGDPQSFAQNSSPSQNGGSPTTPSFIAPAANGDAPSYRRHDGALDIQV